MNRKFLRVAAIVLSILLFCGIACAEDVNSKEITKDLDRIKTKHDGGFVKEETIDKNDLHYGWGLGVFYIQGYSKKTYDTDGVPVFLCQEGDRIMLGFRLKQNPDALGGKDSNKINGDTNGYDSEFAVEKTNFGKGCLILRKTDAGGVPATDVYPDYLLDETNAGSPAQIGPLTEGTYDGALDYEVKYSGLAGIPGYNDYKIPFSFKIQTVKDYSATAVASLGISDSGTRSITIIVSIVSILVFFVIMMVLAKKRNAKYGPLNEDEYAISPKQDPEFGTSSDSEMLAEIDPENGTKPRRRIQKWQIVVIAAIILAVILFVVYPFVSNPKTYPNTIRYLDERVSNANALMVGTSSASFVISIFPDDMGTPLANELGKIAGYMVLVISAILLEKYLLTSIATVASTIVPIVAFVMLVLYLYLKNGQLRTLAAEYGIRLVIFGLCLVLVIPLGCACGRMIEETNQASINNSLKKAEQANEIVGSLPEGAEDKSILQKALDSILSGVKKQIEWANDMFSNFLKTTAVMLVTTIAIPVLILFAIIWLIRFLTKKDFTHAIVSFSKRFSNKTAETIVTAGKTTRKIIEEKMNQ